MFLLVLPAVSRSQGLDTLRLTPIAPDSVYLKRSGADIVIGWYPADDSIAAVIGSRDFRNWFSPGLDSTKVSFQRAYIDDIDRMVKFLRVRRDTVTLGVDTSIVIMAETEDRFDVYQLRMDIGASHYTPDDPIPLVLIGQGTGDTLDLGVDIIFSDGQIGTDPDGGEAFFRIDFQDFEGFHIFRGYSPYPSDMEIIAGISKEDAALGVEQDSLYFVQWPKYDALGRKYYEWTDNNVFNGFTYRYTVSTYDRGFFFGRFQHNKWDSYICEDPEFEQHYDYTVEPLDCDDIALAITMTVNTSRDVKKVFAVPNPYRTGTSAETTPAYHPYNDGTIKFFNMPVEADLKIFTISGDLVWETHHSSPDGLNGIASWNTRNKHNEEVASGVYIFRVESDTGDHVCGKIVIIR